MKPDRRAVIQGLAAWAACARRSGAAEAGDELRLDVAGGAIDLSMDGRWTDLSRDMILSWVQESARAVTSYFGRFPVSRARVRIRMEGERGVSRGHSIGFHGARCSISVAEHATAVQLANDWMLTHEMVHFAFPSVSERHHWIEEGTATYVEPIGRASIGNLSPERAWFEMVRDMPKGQPDTGDRGLDFTPTWGRTYWGGALFCLMADVTIRKSSRNRFGLQDALRAINRAGGNIEAEWPLERAFELGDKATGGRVLMHLYEEMRDKPVTIDLAGLWDQLGVRRQGDTVSFDASAPLHQIRERILGTPRARSQETPA